MWVVSETDTPTNSTAVEDSTFVTELYCANCGTEFDREHPPKTVVSDDSDGVRAAAHNPEFGEHNLMQCPTCELYKAVNISDRHPIDDGDSDQ